MKTELLTMFKYESSRGTLKVREPHLGFDTPEYQPNSFMVKYEYTPWWLSNFFAFKFSPFQKRLLMQGQCFDLKLVQLDLSMW